MLIHQKIEDIICNSNDSSAAIGKFLLKERSGVEDMYLQDIADETYTSQASLVRFAKKLGFSGWKDFVKAYVKEIKYLDNNVGDVDINIPFKKQDSVGTIARDVAKVRREANQDTIEQLNEFDVKKAVRIISQSKRVVICGCSVNVSLSNLFKYKMLRIGKIVENITESEQPFLAYTLTAEDCVIMISYSGNSLERIPTSILPILKERHIPVIGVTSMGENLIREQAECTFTICSRENLYSKIGSFATEESICLILDILYSCYFQENYDENLEYKIVASKSAERRRFLGIQKERK